MEVLAEITAAAFAALFGDGPEARGDAELGYLCSNFFFDTGNCRFLYNRASTWRKKLALLRPFFRQYGVKSSRKYRR